MYWLCSLAGGIVYYTAPHIRRAVRDNMSHVLPDSTEKQRRYISRQVIRNVYKNYYEQLRLPRMKLQDIERKLANVEGIDYLHDAVKLGKGVILVSAHLGNYVLVAQLGPILGYKTATIAEDIKPPQLFNFINRLRGTFGVKFIKLGSGQMRTIYRFLREGGVLALAADRDVSDTGGVKVQFFDAPAELPEGPVVLSMRLGVPLVPCMTWRLPNNKSEFCVYPPVELENTGDFERDFAVNMRKVADILEQMIHSAPEQWMVLQRVWDTPSPGSGNALQSTNGKVKDEVPAPGPETTDTSENERQAVPDRRRS
jgi:KDO2-lipid IV(A) lauroyltransferase